MYLRNPFIRLLLALAVISASVLAADADIYSYIDEYGVTHFSDKPRPGYKIFMESKRFESQTKSKPPAKFFAMQILTLEKVENLENLKKKHGPKTEIFTPFTFFNLFNSLTPPKKNGPKTEVPTLGKNTLVYDDNMIHIEWNKGVKSMEFALDNKTDQNMKILWDESAYVDVDGVNHRLMHSGVKFTDRNSSQPPSVIVRKGKFKDALVPSDNVEWLKDSLSWYEKPLFPSWQEGGTIESFQKSVAPLVGKTFQILLALEIEGTTNDYIFTFRIDQVKTWKEGEEPK